MSQRFLKIKNFKNIGITKGEDEYQTLYLNNSLHKDKIGELIILIGENNVGKSNILDAINSISLVEKSKKAENFTNCIPDFMDYEECLPSLKLVYKDDDNNSYDLELNIDEEGNAKLINNLPKDIKTIEPQLNLDKVKEEIESKLNSYAAEMEYYACNYYNYNESFMDTRNNLLKQYETIINNNSKNIFSELESLYYNIKDLYQKFIYEYNRKHNNKIAELEFVDLKSIKYTKEKKIETYKDIIKEKYDIDFIPNIIFYEEKDIKDEELISTPGKIKNSKFFNSLFKAIGKSMSIITTAYEKSQKTPGYKDQYEETINEKLKDIVNKKFNELYFQNLGVQEYSFEIKLEKDEIYLSMRKNGSIITLAQQSVGFKWFFNFFFNFLYANELKAGDIVLMDEPEIHLSIPGRRDLRKFIKKFARDTGITFICTTHNPSFADIDYLDELRIIKHNKGGIGVKIHSDFSVVGEEVDTLDSIVNSFGILRSDLTREHKIIFVEGITDYNYLTAFKLLYNKDKKEDEKLNLVFLPIEGLGYNDENMKEKLNKLSKMKMGKDNLTVVLVDNDGAAKKLNDLCIKEKLDNKVKIIQLMEREELKIKMYKSDNLIDKKGDKILNEIENLFSPKDIEKYLDTLKSKSVRKSSTFKKIIFEENNKPSKETIDNFNILLEYLYML